MPRVRDLLHADRVLRLMNAGFTFQQAARLDDGSAKLLMEAWDIACDGGEGDDPDAGVVVLHIGGPE